MEREQNAEACGPSDGFAVLASGRSGVKVENLYTLRRSRGRTQGQIAEKMRVSLGAVARIERDPLGASLRDLGDWCQAVGVAVADVLSTWRDEAPVAAPAPGECGREWRFTVAGVPRTKRGADKGAGGRMHSDPVAVDYEQRVAGAASDAGLAAGAGPVSVTMVLHLPNRRRKDADRVASAIFDGMKRAGRAALEDDNLMVIQQTHVILGGIDKLRPRAEVCVREIQGVA